MLMNHYYAQNYASLIWTTLPEVWPEVAILGADQKERGLLGQFPTQSAVAPSRSHREPECTVIYLCPCVFFESFRRDLNEAKAVYVACNVVNY